MIIPLSGFLWPIAASVLLHMFLGFLWYGPLFGKPWREALGWSEDDLNKRKAQGMARTYIWTVLGAFASATALAFVIANWLPTVFGSMLIALGVWTGFVLPPLALSVLFEGRSKKAFWIGACYYLVSLLLSAILFSILYGGQVRHIM